MEGRLKAFTLVEVLLCTILVVLLGVVMVQTLIPIMRYGSWGYARAELVQTTARISDRVAADLATAPFEGVRSGPGVIGIHGFSAVTDSGKPVWSDHLVLYRYDGPSGSLDRMEWKEDVDRSGPTVLDPTAIVACFGRPNGTRRGLARGLLHEFSLSGTELPLKLHLVTELEVPGRAKERLVHDRELYLRNGTR